MPHKRPKTPRKLPQQDRSRIMVEALLEATTQVLVKEGYDKTTTNRIAERAGVSIGSLYQYFPNKESLMKVLMEQHANEIAELVESKLSQLFDQPLAIAIPELIKAVIAAHAIDPRLHQILNEEIPRSERLQQMQSAEKRIGELLRVYLERWSEHIHPQNLEMTIFILGRTVESLCHSAVIEHPDFIIDSHFEQEVSSLLLSYLVRSH